MAQPKLITKAWAADGLKNNIPAERNGGLAQEAATYAEGFPSITMTPISVGGKPPSGKDMNGVLHEITANIVWQNQGGRYRFDQAFCDAIGGYPKGAVLMGDALDTEYISLVDANTHNPNAGGNDGKWVVHAGKQLKASTTKAGIVQLSSATNSDSEELAATSKAVKAAYDKAVESAGKGIPVGAIVAFPRAIASPEGYLKCDGSTFNQATYPDLYAALGSNKLPGQPDTALIGELIMWTADGALPDYLIEPGGQNISRSDYPELFAKWGTRYGNGDGSTTFGVMDVRGEFPRFWDNGRGVDSGRVLGSWQADEFKSHTHGGVAQRAQDRDRGGEPSLFSIDGLSQTEAAGGSETRPRNVAVRACIVAKTPDKGMVYWIKAFGKVTNAGALDASTLAAGLQRKADKNHTHRAADITDLADAVKQQMAAAMQHQAGSNGYVKLPNGLLRQWGYISTTWSGEGVKKVVFPVAFPAECFNVQITTRTGGRQGAINADFTLGADNLTTAGFDVVINGLAFHGASVSDFKGVYWEAVGH